MGRSDGRTFLGWLCLVALVVALQTPTTAAPVKLRSGTFEGAEAGWLVRRGEDVYLYFVLAYRIEKPLKPSKTRLFADRSKCRVKGVRGRRVATCVLEGRVETLRAEQFRMQPGFAGAELDAGPHLVRWNADAAPTMEADPWIDAEAVLADAYLERLAGASGRTFATKVTLGSLDHAALYLGLDAGIVRDLDEPKGPFRMQMEVRL